VLGKELFLEPVGSLTVGARECRPVDEGLPVLAVVFEARIEVLRAADVARLVRHVVEHVNDAGVVSGQAVTGI